MNLFRRGPFTAHSGDTLDWKIECDALSTEDWATLAYVLSQRVFAFGAVASIPSGGVKLAQALLEYAEPQRASKLLIVDDVLTTGLSMELAADIYRQHDVEFEGVVAFARKKPPAWIHAAFVCGF